MVKSQPIDEDGPPPGVIDGQVQSGEHVAAWWRLRGCLWMIAVFTAPVAGLVLLYVLGRLLSWPLVAGFWLLPTAAVVAATLFFSVGAMMECSQRRVERRDLERIIDADGRICLHCRHELAGLPDNGTCPECGKAYTRTQLQASWRWTYRRMLRRRPWPETRGTVD